MGQLYRPFRGHARSHRDIARPEGGAVPVGAGVPAKRPAQVTHHAVATSCSQALCWGNFQHEHCPPMSQEMPVIEDGFEVLTLREEEWRS
ncbi:hypothetical protein EZZ80_20095 [Pseudomonas putida]|nr:hypothetical protein AC138_11510 [Pseudomonas putida]KMY36505.1 hypothetical protein AA993_08740 [Pseudomonas putida]PXZ49086.1 hypothetical protein DM483_15615 [Pseudomonas sp. SMT-1]QDW59438.1 hypothetical protein FFH79_022420 [Pseudomonas sp. KBS0802]UZA75649.1 hypothetical protein EZZ80_20095 [Pseudomonas putida]